MNRSTLMTARCNLFRLLWLVATSACCVTQAQIVDLPPEPEASLTRAGHDLIFAFEGFDARPAWPGGASGVTIGWGYDCGYYSPAVIRHDWHDAGESVSSKLAAQSGVTGRRAKDRITLLRDILVDRQVATDVFDKVDVAREYANCKRAFPGFEKLPPNCQAALISLTYNRGTGMIGPNRKEMREIRDYGVPRRDCRYIAAKLREMCRVWRGTPVERGMTRRRYAEAALAES